MQTAQGWALDNLQLVVIVFVPPDTGQKGCLTGFPSTKTLWVGLKTCKDEEKQRLCLWERFTESGGVPESFQRRGSLNRSTTTKGKMTHTEKKDKGGARRTPGEEKLSQRFLLKIGRNNVTEPRHSVQMFGTVKMRKK